MTTAPDMTDYRAVHDSLRIAAHRMATAAAELEPADRSRARAFATYWRGYAGEVLAHHTIEDDIMFPRLVERVPVAADHLARIEADHHRLDELMDECGAAIARLAAAPTAAGATAAAAVLGELARHMDTHLDYEDEDVVPLIARHFTADEYAALTKAAQDHLGIGRQAAFTVPFVMHWAKPTDGATLIAEAPLAFRMLYRITRRRHARLTRLALGRAATPQVVTL